MKEAYYFSHDSNAKQDPKILALRADFGMEGYGVYWGIIEALREQIDYKIKEDLIIGIIMNLGIENTKAIQMYNKLIQTGLLAIQNNFVYSESLLVRMEKREKISKIRQKSVNKRWKTLNENTKNTKLYNSNTDVIQSYTIKGKEKKGNKIIFITPTLEEVSKYCKERNNSVDPEKFLNYYESKGWIVGRTKMKNWQAAVRTWEGNKQTKKIINLDNL